MVLWKFGLGFEKIETFPAAGFVFIAIIPPNHCCACWRRGPRSEFGEPRTTKLAQDAAVTGRSPGPEGVEVG